MCLYNDPVPLLQNEMDSEGLAGLCHRTGIDGYSPGRGEPRSLEMTVYCRCERHKEPYVWKSFRVNTVICSFCHGNRSVFRLSCSVPIPISMTMLCNIPQSPPKERLLSGHFSLCNIFLNLLSTLALYSTGWNTAGRYFCFTNALDATGGCLSVGQRDASPHHYMHKGGTVIFVDQTCSHVHAETTYAQTIIYGNKYSN